MKGGRRISAATTERMNSQVLVMLVLVPVPVLVLVLLLVIRFPSSSVPQSYGHESLLV